MGIVYVAFVWFMRSITGLIGMIVRIGKLQKPWSMMLVADFRLSLKDDAISGRTFVE
jgi:hypothetical protein